MISEFLCSVRKSVAAVLGWAQRADTRPLAEWQSEFIKVTEEIARSDERVEECGILVVELARAGQKELARDYAMDYNREKARLIELQERHRRLKEEEERRGWYYAMRKKVVS
jgi:hypothetical protein